MPSDRPPTPIKLVVFDLGRVLVRICDDWLHACTTAGIELSPEKLDVDTLLSLRELVYQVEVNAVSFDEFAQCVGAAVGASSDQITRASEAFLIELYPGVPELLTELHAAGVATACLSNTNEHHWEMLADPGHHAFGPLCHLKHQFASHLIRARKPDDAIYAHLEEATGMSGPAILFFDDVEENVQAARARGWHATRVDPARNDPLSQIRPALAEHGIRLDGAS
jgi:HAD superfamily hydrolase (TIGR01509 family)